MFVSVFGGKCFEGFFLCVYVRILFFFLYCFFKTEFLGEVPEFKPTILYVENLNEFSNYRLSCLF